MGIEPKPGTGWEEGDSVLDNVRRWRTPLGGGVYLLVTIADELAWVIARGVDLETSPRHMVPMPQDMRRIQEDFGVRAWSFKGVSPVAPPAVGQALMAMAVEGMN